MIAKHTRKSVILGLLAKRKKAVAGAALLAVAGSALGLIPYFVVYRIAVQLFSTGSGAQVQLLSIGWLALLAGAAILLKSWFTIESGKIAHRTAFSLLYDLRMLLANKLSSLPLGFFGQHSTGDLKKVLHEDVEQIEEGVAHSINDLAAAAAVPFFTAILMAVVDWRMALFTISVVPLLLWVYARSFKIVKAMFPGYHVKLAAMNSVIIQYVQGMKVIKAFAQMDRSSIGFKKSIEEYGQIYAEMLEKRQWNTTFQQLLIRANILVILPAGTWLYVHQSLDLPTFVFFLIMGFGFNVPLYQLLQISGMISYRVTSAMKKIDSVLEQPLLPEPDQSLTPDGYSVEFVEAGFRYQDVKIVDDVSFRAEEGSVTALVGPSGAGKTTIVKLIPRFWDVEEGEVRVGGVNVKQLSSDELMNGVSFVFQDIYLFNDTILENIRVGKADATQEEVIAAARKAKVHTFVQELEDGYQTVLGENGATLSGGQRQRISIARAILKDAPIVVLDEATACMDAENEADIQEAISELAKNKTLLIIAHRLSTIKNADQILVIDKGTISARGTHDELIKASGLYRTLWHSYEAVEEFSFTDREISLHLNAASTDSVEPTEPLNPSGQTSKPYTNPYSEMKHSSFFGMIFNLIDNMRGRYMKAVSLLLADGLLASVPIVCAFLTLHDLMLGSVEMGKVMLYSAIAGLAFLLQFGFNFFGMRALLEVQAKVPIRLRAYLGEHLRRVPLGFFNRSDTGKINSLITLDIQQLNFIKPTVDVLNALIGPMISAVMLLFIDWRMAVAAFVGIPLAFMFLKKGDRAYHEVFQDLAIKRTEANSSMIEYIQGVQVIRSFNLGGDRFKKYTQAMNKYRESSMQTVLRLAPVTAQFLTVLELGFIAIIVAGAYFYQSGSLSGESYLLFLFVGMMLYKPLGELNGLVSFRRSAGQAMSRINDLLSEPYLPEPECGKEPIGTAIQFKHVSFGYASKQVLDDVSFTIQPGSFTALVGPSGAGKSTIASLIARFWDVDKGSITLGGADIRDLRLETLLSKLTLVFQDVYLFRDTIANNIRFGNPEATDDQVISACKAAQCHDFIVSLEHGYNTVISEGGSTLSGGEKQRLSIARALLKDAPIVLLDEATASIDPENEWLLQQAFLALTKDKTLIVISHKLSTLKAADQIVVLDHGRIADSGRHEQLVNRPGLYRNLWNKQQREPV